MRSNADVGALGAEKRETMSQPSANMNDVEEPAEHRVSHGAAACEHQACSQVGQVQLLVERSDGLNRTRKLAEDYARRAIQMLEEFPPSIYRDAIIGIPEFILNRTA